jgi:hypothetical protein
MSSFANIHHSATSWFKMHFSQKAILLSNFKSKQKDHQSFVDSKILEHHKRKISFAHEISELLIKLKAPKTINALKKRAHSIEEKHALESVIGLIHKCLEAIEWIYYQGQKRSTPFDLYLQSLITQVLSSEDLNENQKIRIHDEISQHLEKELSKAQNSSEKSSLAVEICQIREKVWPVLQKIALYEAPGSRLHTQQLSFQ